MHKEIKLLSFCVIIFIILVQFAYAEEYTRSYKFKPIHIERNELLQSASEIFQYVKNINGKAIETKGYLELGSDDYSTNLNLPLDQNVYDKFPRLSYNGSLRITASDGIVSFVSFRLSDYSRELTVVGTSNDHVIGVIKVVQEKIGPYEFQFAGYGFRSILAAVLLGLFMLITFPYSLRLEGRNYAILLVGSMIAVNLVLWLPPWSKIFPGFLSGIENRSFFEKNAALFTFLGFVITIFLPILNLVNRSRSHKKK